jgi:methylenetetrahydrofolate reductase (NADPH)
MHISHILNSSKISFSFEFFPPKDHRGAEQLFRTIRDLFVLNPSYVSVTYGAGGSTRELTHDLVLRIRKETSMTVVSHLTCVGAAQEEILAMLAQYCSNGIQNIMALRGDPPTGQQRFQACTGGFAYAAELVAFIKKHFPDAGIGVAGYPEGHPETPNRLKEMDYLKAKVDAGADYICTQLFFDNRDFYDFRERCILAHINIPIIAGLMPITTLKGTLRMAELAAGTRFPAPLLKAVLRAQNDQEVENAGINWATNQVSDLIANGVQGIHFYTLNQSKATLKIYESLGGADSLQRR